MGSHAEIAAGMDVTRLRERVGDALSWRERQHAEVRRVLAEYAAGVHGLDVDVDVAAQPPQARVAAEEWAELCAMLGAGGQP